MGRQLQAEPTEQRLRPAEASERGMSPGDREGQGKPVERATGNDSAGARRPLHIGIGAAAAWGGGADEESELVTFELSRFCICGSGGAARLPVFYAKPTDPCGYCVGEPPESRLLVAAESPERLKNSFPRGFLSPRVWYSALCSSPALSPSTVPASPPAPLSARNIEESRHFYPFSGGKTYAFAKSVA